MNFDNWYFVVYDTGRKRKISPIETEDQSWEGVYYVDTLHLGAKGNYLLVIYPGINLNESSVLNFLKNRAVDSSLVIICHKKYQAKIEEMLFQELSNNELAGINSRSPSQQKKDEWIERIKNGTSYDFGVNHITLHDLTRFEDRIMSYDYVENVMNTNFQKVSPKTPLRQVIDQMIETNTNVCVVLGSRNIALGIFTIKKALKAIERGDDLDNTLIEQRMMHLGNIVTVGPQYLTKDAQREMAENNRSKLVVEGINQQVLGIVFNEDLLRIALGKRLSWEPHSDT